ncbi:uncharacterized protein Herp [Lepeophtheirus salmonis]|uniref:uncharacterized protein Herp n=1 Tax=Lepeophtheirus salmonis TaxID=72036 RepID=UPI001AE7DD6D|nr:homocysteine-responsive endoplasmic reticulum-resident ubiquitin-like domain member 1 protein [Lepeophtheirus salmonis]
MIRLKIKSVDFKEQIKDLEVPKEWSVEDVKKEVRRTMAPYPSVENQRLIHSGKLLKDECILESFLSLQDYPHHFHLALKDVNEGKGADPRADAAQAYLQQIYSHYFYFSYYYMAYCMALEGRHVPQTLPSSFSAVPPAPAPTPNPPPPAPEERVNPVQEEAPQEGRRDGLELIYISIQLLIFSCIVYFNGSGTRIAFVVLVWFLLYLFKRRNEAHRLREAAAVVERAPPPPAPPRHHDHDSEEEDTPLIQQEENPAPPPPNPHPIQQVLSIFVSFFTSLIPEPEPLHG